MSKKHIYRVGIRSKDEILYTESGDNFSLIFKTATRLKECPGLSAVFVQKYDEGNCLWTEMPEFSYYNLPMPKLTPKEPEELNSLIKRIATALEDITEYLEDLMANPQKPPNWGSSGLPTAKEWKEKLEKSQQTISQDPQPKELEDFDKAYEKVKHRERPYDKGDKWPEPKDIFKD